MALISASDYAKLPSSIAEEKKAFAYQAANPQYSSYAPSTATANGANPYAAYGAPQAYVPKDGVTTAAGANPDGSMTKSIFRDPSGKVTGLRRADGTIVQGFEINPTELAEFESSLGGGVPKTNETSQFAFKPVIKNAEVPTPPMGQPAQQNPTITGMAYSPSGTVGNIGMGAVEGAQFGYPGMPQMSSGTGSNGFAVKTPEQIKTEAKARTDALLAKQTTVAGQTKQGFQTSFDRLAATTKDDRTLQDAAFQRNTNPFGGGADYKAAMIGRERETTDRQASQDLQTRLANVDLSLADYANATDAQRMQMEDQMTQAERSYGLQVDQLALQRQGQAQSQYNADRSFNYGVSRDNVGDSRFADTTNYNRSRDSLTDARYNDTTAYNRGRDTTNDAVKASDTAYNRGQDQINNNRNAANDAATFTANYTSPQTAGIMQKISANSSAWFNASPTERTRLAAENQSLGASIGAKQDESGNWIMPQPQRTVAGQQMDSQAKEITYNHGRDDIKDNQWKQTFDYNKQQNDVQQTAQYAGMYNGQPTMQKIMQGATIANMTSDNARAAASEARAAGNNQLAKRFDIWDRTGSAPEGIPGVAAGTQLGGKKSLAQTAETYTKVVDNVAQYATDPDTKVKKLSNPQQVEDTILLSGLSDYEQYKLYMQHGLKWDDPIPKAPGKP